MGHQSAKVAHVDRYARAARRQKSTTLPPAHVDKATEPAAPVLESTPPVDESAPPQAIADESASPEVLENEPAVFDVSDIRKDKRDIAVETDLTAKYICQMEQTVNDMTCELVTLKKEVNDYRKLHSITEENFTHGEKVQAYTGLTKSCILKALLDLVGPYLMGPKCSLTKFQQLMLCLMKLRLNLPVMVLADIFQVCPGTVRKVFNTVLDVLHVRTKFLIYWPEREELHKTMPLDFKKHFGNKCTAIIDCCEVLIERPSSLQARAQTWSNYKEHDTIKYLIGISPQGSVTFISEDWGGRTSDKHWTENCGFLKKLRPGDLILADKGFNIEDRVGLMCASVQIPAFTKGASQLSPLDVENTRKIASIRILKG